MDSDIKQVMFEEFTEFVERYIYEKEKGPGDTLLTLLEFLMYNLLETAPSKEVALHSALAKLHDSMTTSCLHDLKECERCKEAESGS